MFTYSGELRCLVFCVPDFSFCFDKQGPSFTNCVVEIVKNCIPFVFLLCKSITFNNDVYSIKHKLFSTNIWNNKNNENSSLV